MAKYWMGPKPIQCDVCHDPIDGVFIDGRTKMGPWAIMCPDCYRQCGVGVGIGGGQRYEKQETGSYVKTDG